MPKSQKATFFAVISDIHANIDALDAVLDDMKKWPVRTVLCLGDIVGYGPEPAACVKRVMEHCAVTVLGNHETILFGKDDFDEDDRKSEIGAPIVLAAKQMDKAQMKWLHQLPIAADLDPVMLVHSSLHEPMRFHYLLGEKAARAHFAAQTTFISFVGHSHLPMAWEANGDQIHCYQAPDKPVRLDADHRYAVNVGSVGQPRDGDTRASYALYDYENKLLLHRRVEYDIQKAKARFKKAKLPAANAKRLSDGR